MSDPMPEPLPTPPEPPTGTEDDPIPIEDASEAVTNHSYILVKKPKPEEGV